MAIRPSGPITSRQTDRGDYAVLVNGVECFYADLEAEADYFKTFLDNFSIAHAAASGLLGFVRRLGQMKTGRVDPELSRVVDVKSELVETSAASPELDGARAEFLGTCDRHDLLHVQNDDCPNWVSERDSASE